MTTTTTAAAKSAKPRARRGDDFGKPRRGWTIGGSDVPNNWPRKLPEKLRTEQIVSYVPSLLGLNNRLFRAVQAQQFLSVAKSPDAEARDAARRIVDAELWRCTAELQRRLDYLAELARLTDETDLPEHLIHAGG